MLRFEIDYEDADWWMNVVRDNKSYDKTIGNISRSIQGSHYLFAPEDCVCLSVEEMIAITDKMKELENARTKAD
jgi:hypothetical protein